jgi:LPXTG-motif cell wall-anchored protein
MKTARWIILLIAGVLLTAAGWLYASFRRESPPEVE